MWGGKKERKEIQKRLGERGGVEWEIGRKKGEEK